MIGPMIGTMLAAAGAEEQARLREKFCPGTEGEITPEQLRAAMPCTVFELWETCGGKGLPTEEEVQALEAEHGQEAAQGIVEQRFLGFERSKLEGQA